MIDSANTIRKRAWDDLDGKWVKACTMALLMFMFSILFSSLSRILLYPALCGYSVSFLLNHRGAQHCLESDMLGKGYKQFARITGTMLLEAIYCTLWGLVPVLALFAVSFDTTPDYQQWWAALFALPYIYKSIQYTMVPYILHDYPHLRFNRAISLSTRMMKGNILKYIGLQLSFFGWWILVICTFGLAYLWLSPYIKASEAIFYEQVKEDYENRFLSKHR